MLRNQSLKQKSLSRIHTLQKNSEEQVSAHHDNMKRVQTGLKNPDRHALPPATVQQLQSLIGNSAVQRLINQTGHNTANTGAIRDIPATPEVIQPRLTYPDRTLQRAIYIGESEEKQTIPQVMKGMPTTKSETGRVAGAAKIWVNDKETHRYNNYDELLVALRLFITGGREREVPEPVLIKRNKTLLGNPDREGDTFYRTMSNAELQAFIKEGGLTARLNSQKQETGQQFITANKDYSIKTAKNTYIDNVRKNSPNPLDSYRWLVKLVYADEGLEYMVTHPRTRVGSGDERTQRDFEGELKLQQKDEQGVIIVKNEPLEGGGRALNIGFTPRTDEHDPRREFNQLLIHAAVIGEFVEPKI